MTRPGFFQGALVALCLALASGAVFTLLGPMVGFAMDPRLPVAAVVCAYLIYLVGKSVERTGRVITAACWLAVTAAALVFDVGVTTFILLQIVMIWLVRSLYFHSSVLASLADLGLSGLAVGAFVWAATQTGSVFLSVWCFFLVQALFIAIPASTGRKPRGTGAAPVNARFDRAHRQADAALRRLLVK